MRHTFRSHAHRLFPTFIVGLVASTVLFMPLARAQEPDRIQAYGGYSFLHPNLPTFDSDPETSRNIESLLGNLSGWNGGVTVGMTKNFGITADFSGYYKNINTTLDGTEFDTKLRAYTFLFGPQFQKNGEQLRPFVRALFGLARGTAKAKIDGESVAQASRNVFAGSLGGGLDVRVSSRIAIRAAQLDYYPFRSSEGGGLTFNNFRFGAGIVYYLSH